ncbi:MAG TPA: hypothetical protein V6C81_06815 [Planktothrix sp.]|jgi:hypothetical protein
MPTQKKRSPRSNGRKGQATVAHKVPGRIRIRMTEALSDAEAKGLVQDLKVSPEVKKVTIRGTSLIIEHIDDHQAVTKLGSHLSKQFPEFERWSDEVDAEIAKAVGDPWVNKSIPFFFLGFAAFKALTEGALFAGESAFALAYVGFDIYWKFQQENVVRKIEMGLSKSDREKVED